MPTKRSRKFLCTVKINVYHQDGDLSIFSTRNGNYSIVLSWEDYNKAMSSNNFNKARREKRSMGPYESIEECVQQGYKWFYNHFKYLTYG